MSRRPFLPSPSPEEVYEGDPDQEWAVTGIVGESIGGFGETRYEIKWGEGWRRRDGTNTTWDRPREEFDELAARWQERQIAKRLDGARRSGGAIEVGIEDWHPLHEDVTLERARGYEELKEVYMPDGNPVRRVDFDGTRLSLATRRRDSRTRTPASRPVSVSGRTTPSSVRSEKMASPSAGPSRTRSSSSMSASPARVTKPLPRRAVNVRRVVTPPTPGPDEDDVRTALEERWAEKLDGAAPVYIVNEVNYEEVPPLVENFEYVERSYIRAPGVPTNDEVADHLVSCDCQCRCPDAADCGCQAPSEWENDAERKVFAYTKKGFFDFDLIPGMEVIECNKGCSCGVSCRNRVAQCPRDVPIEVFRTRNCGWGARATVRLLRGKVIGIYTGRLIRREEAERYKRERKMYIFDLDVRELSGRDDTEEHRYSVDGYACGNWTRFINHSCEPNLKVISVVWDTIPELNQPYLAFVVTKDILPRTELTLDYDPKAGSEFRKGKSKYRPRVPEGARGCKCGTVSCRGYMRV